MAIVSFGFTGTRLGMTDVQRLKMMTILGQHEGEFHHGDCVGSDAEAHDLVQSFMGRYQIHVHPPVDDTLRAWKIGQVTHPVAPYLKRNKDIVNMSDFLIATPASKQAKGGTWHAINYAMSIGKHFLIILPDGEEGHSKFIPDKTNKGPNIINLGRLG